MPRKAGPRYSDPVLPLDEFDYRVCQSCRLLLPVALFRVHEGRRQRECRDCYNRWQNARRQRLRDGVDFEQRRKDRGITEQACNLCGETRPVGEFSPSPTKYFGLHATCKRCQSQKALKWREDNPERYLDYHMRRRYGITLDEYNAMLIEQGGACAICGEPPTFENSGRWTKRRKGLPAAESRLVVDHCHATGKIRGLLCGRCNTGIGHLQDDPSVVGLALKYLKERG